MRSIKRRQAEREAALSQTGLMVMNVLNQMVKAHKKHAGPDTQCKRLETSLESTNRHLQEEQEAHNLKT